MKTTLRLDRPSTRTEIMIGRTLASCVHPFAAWRLSAHRRALIVVTYSAAAYIIVLSALLALNTRSMAPHPHAPRVGPPESAFTTP
jgi:hypothetical protein